LKIPIFLEKLKLNKEGYFLVSAPPGRKY